MRTGKKFLSHFDRLASMNATHAFIGAILAAVAYDKLVPHQSKMNWQNSVGMHHGEAGVLALVAGALTKSPALAAAGLGLAVHDRKDAPKWFKSNGNQEVKDFFASMR
jgi:hypothetical protein